MGVKGFRTLDGSIEKYDYKYLENTPTKLSDFKNDIFGEQREVINELTESSFVYDEGLSAYTIQIGTKLTWLIADNTVNNVLGYDLVRYNSSLGAYELITEQESPFVVENGVISFENFKIFNGLKPSTTGEYEEVDECWIVCDDPNFGEEGYINLFQKYTKVSESLKDVFFATANVTTSAEIEEAYQSGKLIVLNISESLVVPSMHARLSATTHIFVFMFIGSTVNIHTASVENDVWGESEPLVLALKEELEEFSSLKANKSTISTSTMSASGWSDSVYSFESTYPVATYDIEVALDSTATIEQAEAFNGAQIVGSATSNVVKAYGIVPTVDIPICIKAVMK